MANITSVPVLLARIQSTAASLLGDLGDVALPCALDGKSAVATHSTALASSSETSTGCLFTAPTPASFFVRLSLYDVLFSLTKY